jgi:imidazolonepropionase-like amidohydrolase
MILQDIHRLPIATVLDLCAHSLPFAVGDGVEDCIQTIRLQLRKGAKFINVCASGGVFSEIDSVLDTQFSPEELKAMVDEAARARRVVAAHCHANAGVKNIEHVSWLNEECVVLMKEKDAILVCDCFGCSRRHATCGRASSDPGKKAASSCLPQ